ncbi:hypothetical protein LINGRAHAP2_LOCUS9922 [Linum grandiflorum]
MRFLFCSSRNSTVVSASGKVKFLMSTAKRIMLSIIWLILASLSLTRYICLNIQI